MELAKNQHSIRIAFQKLELVQKLELDQKLILAQKLGLDLNPRQVSLILRKFMIFSTIFLRVLKIMQVG